MKVVFLMMLFIEIKAYANDYDPYINPKIKWNGVGTHPAKRQAYLKSDDLSGCHFIVYHYQSVKHSPGAYMITSPRCLMTTDIGKGVHKKRHCAMFDIGWNGKHKLARNWGNIIANPGICDKKNQFKFIEFFNHEIKKLRKSGFKVLFGVTKDTLNVKSHLYHPDKFKKKKTKENKK